MFHLKTSAGDCPGEVTMETQGVEEGWGVKGGEGEASVFVCGCVCVHPPVLLVHYQPSQRQNDVIPKSSHMQTHIQVAQPQYVCVCL